MSRRIVLEGEAALAEAIGRLRDGGADEIIVAGGLPGAAGRAALIAALHGSNVGVRYWSQPPPPPRPLGQRMRKRALDLVLAGLGLPLILPLMAVIALLIRLDGPGPVLFRQRRLGLGAKAFHILKFRTMAVAASWDESARPAEEADSRITPIGHFLRRHGLDELPQIFNVLRGEMSLVGPRPHAFPHDVMWSETVEGYGRRFAVPPGITGLAQVSGGRGRIADRDSMAARLALDLEYIREWSPWLDLKILARTVRPSPPLN